MSWWTVEVRGNARELYSVEAETKEEAMARWHEGKFTLGEITDCEPVNAEQDE